MRVVLRATFTVLALASLVLAGAGAVRGATQPTVGGTLSVNLDVISVFSNGNVPAHVAMSAESVTLSETSFDIDPGETHSLTFTGRAVGHVTALYTVIPLLGAEAGSAQLTIGLAPYVAPFDWAPLGLGGLAGLGLILVLRRVRPWRYRLVVPADAS